MHSLILALALRQHLLQRARGMRSLILALAACTLCFADVARATSFLSVEGQHLTFGGKKVFLSGANQPWIDYGNDFGNNQTNAKRCSLQDYILAVFQSRWQLGMWVFIEGDSIGPRCL